MAKSWNHGNSCSTASTAEWAGERSVGIDDGPCQVGLLNVLAEQHHLAADRVDLGVGAHARLKAAPPKSKRPTVASSGRDPAGWRALLESQISPGVPYDVDEGIESWKGQPGSGSGPRSAMSTKAGVSKPP